MDESRCATSVVGFDAKSSAETDSNSGAGVAMVGLCRVQVLDLFGISCVWVAID